MPTTLEEPLAALKLKRGEDRRLRAGHLWVFSNEIDVSATPLSALESGQLVQIESDRGQNLGLAYVNPRALICARILARAPATSLDPGFSSGGWPARYGCASASSAVRTIAGCSANPTVCRG